MSSPDLAAPRPGPGAVAQRWAVALPLGAAGSGILALLALAIGSRPLYLGALGAAIALLLLVTLLHDAVAAVMDWAVKATIVWTPLGTGLSAAFGPLREVVRNLDGILTLFSLGLLALSFLRQGRIVIRATPANLPLVLLLAVNGLAIALNNVPLVVGAAGIRAILQFVVLYYVLVYLHPSPAQQRGYLAISVVTSVVIAALTLLQLVYQTFVLHLRTPPAVTLTDRSALGLYLLFHILLMLAFVFKKVTILDGLPALRARLPWLTNAVILAALILALIATNGRTAWVGVVIGLVAMSLVTGYARNAIMVAGLALLMVVGFIRLSGISDYYDMHYYQLDRGSIFDRIFLLTTTTYYRNDMAEGRLYYSGVSLQAIADHPIVGVGPGRWGGWVASTVFLSPLYPQYHVIVRWGQFDSAFFPFWAENGTLGLICFLWLWAAIGRQGLRLVRAGPDAFVSAIGLATFAVLVTTLILAFITPLLEQHAWAAYLWLIGGLATVSYRQLQPRTG